MKTDSFRHVPRFAPRFALPAAFALVVACGGGGGAPGAATPSGANTPEQINKTKCGGCHSPFDPGSYTKEQLAPIMKTHKDEKRANLSDDEWTKLADYLAKK